MSQAINRVSGGGVLVLSLAALATVLIGYVRAVGGAPEICLPDEGALAHIFQLTIALLALLMLAFLATADWSQPVRSGRALAIPALALIVAFGALYYGEHYFCAMR